MNPKTKKYLLIGGAVVAVAAIWWFFGRKKGSTTTTKIKAPKGAIQKAVKKAVQARKGKPVEPAPTASPEVQ